MFVAGAQPIAPVPVAPAKGNGAKNGKPRARAARPARAALTLTPTTPGRPAGVPVAVVAPAASSSSSSSSSAVQVKPGTAVVLAVKPATTVVRRKIALAPAKVQQQLGAYPDEDALGGLSLKGALHSVRKVATNVGHAVGTAVTSKVGQGLLGVGLAATGVGLLPAIAIGAGVKGVGTAIKPGGSFKSVATGAAQGAALGAGSSLVGTGARAVISKVTAPKASDTAAASSALDRAAEANAAANTVKVNTIANADGSQSLIDDMNAPGGGGLPAVASNITTDSGAPAPATLPMVPLMRQKTDATPPFTPTRTRARSRQKTGGSDLSSSIDAAGTTLAVGKAAKNAADNSAAKVKSLSDRLRQLENAASAASQAGDAAGASGFAGLAQQLAQQLQDAQSAAQQAQDALHQAGNAAEGAAAGAVGGSAVGAIGDFFAEHKLGVGLTVGGIVLALLVPRLLRSAPRARMRVAA